jgi:hypothetical protein
MLRTMSASGASDRGLAPPARGQHVRLARVIGFVLIAVILLLALAQLLLPQIAARVLRDRVGKYGEVQSASVKALPAIELLWGSADSASLRAKHLQISPHELVSLLREAEGIADLSVRSDSVTLTHPGFGVAPVSLQDASLQKHGQSIHVTARLTRESLQAALPAGIHAQVLSSEDGKVRVSASGQLFGFDATVEAVLHAARGKLVLVPTRPLLAGFAKVTLFSEAHLEVLEVSAQAVSEHGQRDRAWLLSMKARLR